MLPVPRALRLPPATPLHARPRTADRLMDRRSTACRPSLSGATGLAEQVVTPSTTAEPQRHKVAIFVVRSRPAPCLILASCRAELRLVHMSSCSAMHLPAAVSPRTCAVAMLAASRALYHVVLPQR